MKRKPISEKQTPDYPSFEDFHAKPRTHRYTIGASALLATALAAPGVMAEKFPEIMGDIALPEPLVQNQPKVNPAATPVPTRTVAPRLAGTPPPPASTNVPVRMLGIPVTAAPVAISTNPPPAIRGRIRTPVIAGDIRAPQPADVTPVKTPKKPTK